MLEGGSNIEVGSTGTSAETEISGLSVVLLVLLVLLAGTISQILDATSSGASTHEDGALNKNENKNGSNNGSEMAMGASNILMLQ